MATKTTAAKKSKKSAPVPAEKLGNLGMWASHLVDAAERRGMTGDELCAYLNITPGYLSLLLRGGASGQKLVSREILQRSAEILGVSLLNAYMLSGLFSHDDFYVSADAESMADEAYALIMRDSRWAPHMMPVTKWNTLSINERLGIVLLYQTATRNIIEDLIKDEKRREREGAD